MERMYWWSYQYILVRSSGERRLNKPNGVESLLLSAVVASMLNFDGFEMVDVLAGRDNSIHVGQELTWPQRVNRRRENLRLHLMDFG
jgi:hypothetical protein